MNSHRPNSRAFTLIEMLVVIGIIVLLASLVLAVSGGVIRASEERSTRNTIEVLNAALEEYERSVERRVTYATTATNGSPADPAQTGIIRYDILSAAATPPAGSGVAAWTALDRPYGSLLGAGLPAYSTKPFQRTANLIWILSQSTSSASIMQKLPESRFKAVKTSNGQGVTAVRHVVDAWDNPIIAIFPGRDANSVGVTDPAANIDEDGTIKCDSEIGLATNNTAAGLGVICRNRKVLFASAGVDGRFTVQVGSAYKASPDNIYSYDPIFP
ncbi:MAG: type II secretion system protein [Limnohabitans sp.]|nr:type II secretion system protein [Limnohabitans sp.]